MLVTEPGALPDKHRRRNWEFKNVKFLEKMRLSILCFFIYEYSQSKKRPGGKEKRKRLFSFVFLLFSHLQQNVSAFMRK